MKRKRKLYVSRRERYERGIKKWRMGLIVAVIVTILLVLMYGRDIYLYLRTFTY